eukprot:14358689-Alexandrium_andersonii.AAC.1
MLTFVFAPLPGPICASPPLSLRSMFVERMLTASGAWPGYAEAPAWALALSWAEAPPDPQLPPQLEPPRPESQPGPPLQPEARGRATTSPALVSWGILPWAVATI